MNKDDPYLNELDGMEGLSEEESTEGTEAPTRLDVSIPSLDESEPLAVGEKSGDQASTRELLSLSPDVPVQVVAVLGRKSVTVKDLLGLKSGSVVDLEKLPNEPVEILAAGKVVAKGELVTVDGKLGVRILKLLK